MIVVLLGYMGSGKSSVGRALSTDLGLKFVDLDTAITEKVNMDIPQIFSEKGELFFRKLETEVLKQLLGQQTDLVLALGGGTPCYGNNMDIVSSHTDNSFYLKLSISGLVNRLVKEKEQRPLIKDISDEALPEFIGKHLFERSPFYSRANHTIAIEHQNIDVISKQIRALLI